MQRWLMKSSRQTYGIRTHLTQTLGISTAETSTSVNEEESAKVLADKQIPPKTILLGVYQKAEKEKPKFTAELISQEKWHKLWKATVSVDWPTELSESATGSSKTSAESKAALQLYLRLKNDFKIVDSSFKIGKSDPNSKEPTVAKPQFELPSDAQELPVNFLDQFPMDPKLLLWGYCETRDAQINLEIQSTQIGPSGGEESTASTLWFGTASVNFPTLISSKVVDNKKTRAEAKAAGVILLKLQEMGYINERFVDPTIELTETLAITLMDELSRLQVQSAPSLLREFYDAAAHEFPELIYSQRGSLWFCSLKMTWPVDFQTQKMYHLSKSRTKQRVCALAVKKLSEMGHFDDKFNPVAYTKAELQKLYDSYREPIRLPLPANLSSSVTYLRVSMEKLKAEFAPLYDKISDGKVITSLEDFSDESDATLNFHRQGYKLNIISGEPLKNDFASNSFLESSRNHELYTAQRKLELDIRNQKVESDIFEQRKMLPIAAAKTSILEAIEANQVVLITGETGSGKSTQVPQFILESWIQQFKGSRCNIVMTQPRRISAISIADRIALERREQLGETTGFNVRMEKFLVKKPGALVLCTPGMLLNCILQNEDMEGISHVILDEIHERDILSDFLLITIKRILKINPNLKLILMSATGDMRKLLSYFEKAEVVPVGGRSYRVKEYFLNDIKTVLNDDSIEPWQYQKPRQIISFDTLVNLIAHIHCNKPVGAILCFLPTWNDILIAKERLAAKELPLEIHCAHSRVSIAAQRRIFDKPKNEYRKVILATNIAETSITINDVVYVVNSGLTKDASYKPALSATEEKIMWAPKASQIQRRGRAGRLTDGECYHLMSSDTFARLSYHHQPPMQRSSVENLVILAKLFSEHEPVKQFLSEAMDPPSEQFRAFLIYIQSISEKSNSLISVETAISGLRHLNILDAEENLTLLGRHLAHLKCNPRLAISLLYSAIFNCVDPVLSLCGYLESSKPLVGFGVVEQSDLPEQEDEALPVTKAESDLLFSSVAISCYEELHQDPTKIKDFMRANSFDSSVFPYLCGMKSILANGLLLSGIIESTADCWDPRTSLNQQSTSEALVKICLLRGLKDFLLKRCVGKYLKTRIKWTESVFLDKCGAFIQFDEAPDTADSPYFLYSNKKLDHEICIVKSATNIHPIFPAIAGGTELTLETTTNSDEKLMSLDNDKRFRYILTAVDAENLMAVREAFKDISELFLLQQYGADEQQKKKLKQTIKVLTTVIKTLSNGEWASI